MAVPSASMWRWNPAKAAGIAWGRGGRPSGKEIREKVDREREEARQRAQKRIDERKAITQARHERERQNVERYHAGLEKESIVRARAQEAQAAILETEAQKAEDQNWVTEFTPQQEHEIAGLETAVQRVKSGVISGDIGLEDGGKMVQAINQKVGSYQKIRRPRRKDEPLYPEGQSVGEVWTTEGGTTLTRGPDGLPKLLVRPDQTPEYQQMKTQQALEEKQRLAEEKRALEVEKFIRTLRTEQIETTIKDAEGKESTGKRYRTPAEVYEATLRGYPELAPQQQAPLPIFGKMPQQSQLQSMPGVEPLAVRQARETKARWKAERVDIGQGWASTHSQEEVDAFDKIIKDWEKIKRKNSRPSTKNEITKASSGELVRHPDGTWRQKP